MKRESDPMSGDASLENAADVIESWLDAQGSYDDASYPDPEDLWDISSLARAGAPEEELGTAIGRARHGGWQWAPIAVLIGKAPRRARPAPDTPRQGEATTPGQHQRHP